jgi:hypothetical protein
MLGVDRDGYLYYIKELHSEAPPRLFAKELREWMDGYRVYDILCDSLGATPGTGGMDNLSFIEVLNKNGIRARSTTFKEKSDESFIASIQNVLDIPDKPNNFGKKLPRLRIFSDCIGIIGDIENVQWLKYRNVDLHKPKLDITHKDYLACLKYALTSNTAGIYAKTRVIRSGQSSWTSQGRDDKKPLYGSLRDTKGFKV